MCTKGISTLSSKWKKRYLDLADHVSSWSKDPSRKIGAVAIGPQGQVLAQGYNGFPRGISDTFRRYDNREIKYKYVVHAEMNCIYNAADNGVSLRGSDLYVTGLPTCSECAKGVIQVGIKRVYMRADVPEAWTDSWNLTQQLFREAGVQYELIAES
jgi:dCMP deaminase